MQHGGEGLGWYRRETLRLLRRFACHACGVGARRRVGKCRGVAACCAVQHSAQAAEGRGLKAGSFLKQCTASACACRSAGEAGAAGAPAAAGKKRKKREREGATLCVLRYAVALAAALSVDSPFVHVDSIRVGCNYWVVPTAYLVLWLAGWVVTGAHQQL